MLKFFLPLTILVGISHPLHSQEWFHTLTGTPTPSVNLNDHFGRSISLDGRFAVIGAPQNDERNLNSGKVLIYEKINGHWQLIQELFSQSGGKDEYFGSVVLLKDPYLFVSAPTLDVEGIKSAGGVLVYKNINNIWTYINTITANDAEPYTQFGSSIAYNGTLLAVGAAYYNSGAVYIFNDPTSQTSQVAKIVLDTFEMPDRFGAAIALNSEELFIADPSCGLGLNRGAVFVYDLQNFNRIAKLVSSYENNFYFGLSLSATETELAVGSPYVMNPDFTYGSVCLFKKPNDGWVDAVEDVRFTIDHSQGYGSYGQSVLLNDTSLIVGSSGGAILDFYDKPHDGWNTGATKFSLMESGVPFLREYGYSFATNGIDVFVGDFNLNVPNESSGAVFKYIKTGNTWSSIERAGILTDPIISGSESGFGVQVSIDGDYAVIGAPYDDESGVDAGAAYVFKFNGNSWQKIAKLTASDAAPGHLFGYSVGISGDVIAVTASYVDVTYIDEIHSRGKVYIFYKPEGGEWSNSTESAVIRRINNLKQGFFGYKVKLKNNLIAISHFALGSYPEIGNVYLLERSGTNWEFKASLSPSNTVQKFGNEIALGTDLVAISGGGAVFLYEKPAGGWVNATQNAILTANSHQSGFGRAVDIDNNTIIVGSPSRSLQSQEAAFIYEKAGNRWVSTNEAIMLVPEGEQANAGFGSAVALSGNIAAVGSSAANSSNGKVFFFRKVDGLWQNTPYFSLEIPPSGGTNYFGHSIDMQGDHVVIGAPGASTVDGKGSGSAEFYLKQPSVSYVSSSSPDGEYRIDDRINIKVVFSHPVHVVGTPIIQMALDNNIVRDAHFKNITNATEVNFEYTVKENDFSNKLDYTSISALVVPEGSRIKSKIIDQDSYNRLPIPGSVYSLSGSRSIVINGKAPVIVGISEVVNSDTDINLYPNPVHDYLHIYGKAHIESVEISNINGTLIRTLHQDFNNMRMTDLSPGMYILKITTNKRIFIKRIVKQ